MALPPKNFIARYPIKHAFWEQMSDTTIYGAALYTFGIDPSACDQALDEICAEDMSCDDLPQDLGERIAIIRSAVRAGLIKKLPNPASPDVNVYTEIYFKSFLEWFEASSYAKKLNQTQGSPTPEPTPETEPANAISDFDPLVLDGIAKMFPQVTDSSENDLIWKDYAKNAKRNDLKQTRTSVGKGKGQSTFCPEKVGEWLINKGKLDRAKLKRILRANLPDRSLEKLDWYD